jgi:hypothetical protein
MAGAGIFADDDGRRLYAARWFGLRILREAPALSLAPEAAELVYVHSCDALEFRLEVDRSRRFGRLLR